MTRAEENKLYRVRHADYLNSPEVLAHKAALARARYVPKLHDETRPCQAEGCTGTFQFTGLNPRQKFCHECQQFYYPYENRRGRAVA